MARTNRADAPWRMGGTRRSLPADARSGRIASDPSSVTALRRCLWTTQGFRHSAECDERFGAEGTNR